jgi:hypothetical protein
MTAIEKLFQPADPPIGGKVLVMVMPGTLEHPGHGATAHIGDIELTIGARGPDEQGLMLIGVALEVAGPRVRGPLDAFYERSPN